MGDQQGHATDLNQEERERYSQSAGRRIRRGEEMIELPEKIRKLLVEVPNPMLRSSIEAEFRKLTIFLEEETAARIRLEILACQNMPREQCDQYLSCVGCPADGLAYGLAFTPPVKEG